MPKLEINKTISRRMETFNAHHKLKKGDVEAQAAREVEEHELKRKAVIKEKERAMRKKEHDVSELVSAEILEDSQNQHEPRDRTEKVQMGRKGEDKDSDLDGNSNYLQHFDYDVMTLKGKYDGNNDLGITASKQNLFEFFGEGQEEEKTEHQKEQAYGNLPEEVPIVEDVMEGV
jgi:hypothetical protein